MRWWMLVAAMAALLPVAVAAQDPVDDSAAVPPAADLLSDDALDELVAPVALYPDALLAQVFMAATYPLDVMKADRFLDDAADVTDAERADLVEDEDWDQSVKALAGGFPDVLGRMADEIDWTEELGDAMLAQTDDLLDAVQRMRARAEAVGNLTTNEAQTVEVQGDSISIAPADPQVVYVPSYDPTVAYTTPVTQPAVVYDDPGVSFGSVLTTGAIAFGSALLVDEIFDDDDDWDDYWHGPRAIDWDDDAIYRGRDIDGDVNIDVDRERNVNRERNVDRDKNVRIGDRDGDQKQRQTKWQADRERSDAARDRIAARNEGGRGGGNRGGGGQGDDGRSGAGDLVRPGGGADRPPRRGGDGAAVASRDNKRTQAEARLKARSDGGGGGAKVPAARDRDRSAASPRPAEVKKPSALKPSAANPKKVAKSKDRAATSLKRDTSPTAVKARAPSASKPKPKAIAKKPATSRAQAPPRKASAKSTAFKKPKVSASRSHAAKSRGGRSGGAKKRR